MKHHFDECVERVHAHQSDPAHKGPKEDCVEECEFPSYPPSNEALNALFIPVSGYAAHPGWDWEE